MTIVFDVYQERRKAYVFSIDDSPLVFLKEGDTRYNLEGRILTAGCELCNTGATTTARMQVWNITDNKEICHKDKSCEMDKCTGLVSRECDFAINKDIDVEIRALYQNAAGSWIVGDTTDLFHLRIGAEPKQPQFEFVEGECYIQYGDDLFCFADDTKDIPPGTNIWAYFKVKNTGEIATRATVKVFDGDTKMCEKTSPDVIQPGGSADFYTFCFKMPDANRDLVMKVYEYGKTEELDSFGC